MSQTSQTLQPVVDRKTQIDTFARRHSLRWYEALPWLAALVCYFAFENYHALGAQIFATILFALSLDLILGYAGIVSLGHAAFFGVGAYTTGILAVHGMGDPLLGLVAAAAVAALAGLASGALILRTSGLTLLMQTLVVAALLKEIANKAHFITGGSDGLLGMKVLPVFGKFRFDLYGDVAYIYCLAALFLGWVACRCLVQSPFGRSLTGIRENVTRMHAIGAPVDRRKLIVYAIAAGLAGISGALIAQTTSLVGLGALDLGRSGELLIMLIIGGIGRLYGAFIGVPLYMIAQDRFSEIDPRYWYFWIGLFMVLLVVFARGGVLGVLERWRAKNIRFDLGALLQKMERWKVKSIRYKKLIAAIAMLLTYLIARSPIFGFVSFNVNIYDLIVLIVVVGVAFQDIQKLISDARNGGRE